MSKIRVVVALLLLCAWWGWGAAGLPAQSPSSQNAEEAQREAARQRAQKLRMGLDTDLADMPEGRLKALLDGLKDDTRMGMLLRGQLEAARAETDARWREFLAGRGTLDIYLGASQRLLQAEFDLSNQRLDRIAALEGYCQRARDVDTLNQARLDAHRINVQDWAQSRYNRLRAEIFLERAKAGRAVEFPQLSGNF
jgi:hypothetical protein